MVSKIWLSTIICLQVTAHAFVNSPIARSRAVVRADDQQPNPEAPCGPGVTDIALLVKNTPPVYAGKDGFFPFIITFPKDVKPLNVTVQVDPSGTGQSLVPVESFSSQPDFNPNVTLVLAGIPPGMRCTAGNDAQTCLAQLTSTASGLHECITFSQFNISGTGTPVQNLAVDPTPSTASGDSTASTSIKITKTHSSTTSAGDLDSITEAGGSTTATEAGNPTSTSKSKRHSATQSGDPSSTDEGGSTTATDAGSPDPTPSAGDPSATDTGGSTDTTPAGDHSTGHTTKYSQTRTAGSSSSTATAKGASVTARSGSLMARSFSE